MPITFIGNGPIPWGTALAVLAGSAGAMYLIKIVLVKRLGLMASHGTTYVNKVAVAVLSSTRPLFILATSLYLAALSLELPAKSERIISQAVVVTVLLQVALWGDAGVREWLARYRQQRSVDDVGSTTSTAALGFLARTGLWLLVTLMILDNLGVNVTTLVASLGIGGIAVALALQNILGDLFSSLSIVLDKPFVIGDFIIVGDTLGTVEYVGLKTTRLRSLGGEQVVFSNSDLLKSRIHNYKCMQTRRIAFRIGVTYQSSARQLRAIPEIVRAIVVEQAHAHFDRAHFKEFAAASLDFEVVYFIDSPDYQIYMDIQQEINLGLFERFAREGIEFAYLTQTLQLANQTAAAAETPAPGTRMAGVPAARAVPR
jgi:small-conductance mechanosensitive channel